MIFVLIEALKRAFFVYVIFLGVDSKRFTETLNNPWLKNTKRISSSSSSAPMVS